MVIPVNAEESDDEGVEEQGSKGKRSEEHDGAKGTEEVEDGPEDEPACVPATLICNKEPSQLVQWTLSSPMTSRKIILKP